MLELVNLVFTGGEVKKLNNNMPDSVKVSVKVDNLTQTSSMDVKMDFTYVVDYAPGVAFLKISGFAFCRDTETNLKAILAEFNKNKTLSPQYSALAINMIHANAGLNSVFLVRPFNLLPAFMPGPLVSVEGGRPVAAPPMPKKNEKKKK